jgi:hypothetical protein
MTDTTTPEPEHPFDPALPSRIDTFIATWKAEISDVDSGPLAAVHTNGETTVLTLGDVAGLRARDAYAEQTRLQLADKCATYRSQRDEAHAEVERLKKQVKDLTHTVSHMLPSCDEPTVPDPGDHWRRVHHALVTEVARIIDPAGAPVTVPPLEAAGIFFPGSTPSAIPAEPTDQLVHMWARDENDNPTGYALCDTGDGANTTIDGKIANSTWQVNCPKCEEIRDRGAEQWVEQDAQSGEYEKWRESEGSAGRGADGEHDRAGEAR